MYADVNHYKSTVVSLVFTLVIAITGEGTVTKQQHFLTSLKGLNCGEAKQGDHTKSERVLLSDVKALILQEGKMTTACRNDAVSQLKCLGGPYYCKSTPKLVQCTNQGSNGSSIQVTIRIMIIRATGAAIPQVLEEVEAEQFHQALVEHQHVKLAIGYHKRVKLYIECQKFVKLSHRMSEVC